MIGLTTALCLPVGIAAAIYLEEYADSTRWYNRLLELNIQNLAGVPSIVFGILGLGLIARVSGSASSSSPARSCCRCWSCRSSSSPPARRCGRCPASIRDGSYALGATRWQTIWRQVLPAAVPGMATGSILALSRAIGEAAPLILLGAVTFVRFNPDSLLSRYTALPIQIYNLIKRTAGASSRSWPRPRSCCCWSSSC